MFLAVAQPAFVSGKCALRNKIQLSYSLLQVSPFFAPRRPNSSAASQPDNALSDSTAEPQPDQQHVRTLNDASQPQNHEDKISWGVKGGRHRRANLGHTRLGRPADIIILDEKYHEQGTSESSSASVDNSATPSHSLEDVIEEVGSKTTTQDDVNANIEAARTAVAKVNTTITAEQLSALHSNMLEGFSTTQLMRYVSTVLEVQKVHSDNSPTLGAASGKSLGSRSAARSWKGSKLPLGEGFALSKSKLRHILNRKHGKVGLSSAIIEHLWRLRTAGQQHSFSIECDKFQAKLLSNGLSAELESICRKQKVKIELLEGKDGVKVSGIAENVEAARRRIEKSIQSIYVQTFHTYKSSLSRFNINPDNPNVVISDYENSPMVTDLEQKYGVAICGISSTQRLNHWKIISYDADDSNVNGALREFYLSQKPARQACPSIWAAEGLKGLRPVPNTFDEGNRDVPSRLKFVRWCGSANQPDGPNLSKSLYKTTTFIPRLTREFSAFVASQEEKVKDTEGISFQLEIGLGQILVVHTTGQKSLDHTTPRSIPRLTMTPIAHLREYPGLPEILWRSSRGEVSRYVKVEIVPVSSRSSAPVISLFYSTTEKDNCGRPQALDAKAVLRQHNYDLLLPHTSVDLAVDARFSHDLLAESPEFVSRMTTLLFDDSKSLSRLKPLFNLSLPPAVQGMYEYIRKTKRGQNKEAKKAALEAAKTAQIAENLDKPLPYMWSSSILSEDVSLEHNNLPLIYSQCTNLETGSKWKGLRLAKATTVRPHSADPQKEEDDSSCSPAKPKSIFDLVSRAKKFAEAMA